MVKGTLDQTHSSPTVEEVETYLQEPITLNRIDEILGDFIQSLEVGITQSGNNKEALEEFLKGKLNELSVLQENINALESYIGITGNKKNELEAEIRGLNSLIAEKTMKLNSLFSDQVENIIYMVRRNIFGAIATLFLAPAGITAGAILANSYIVTTEEQLLINEQNQKVRTALESTFARLGITIDEPYEIAGEELKKSESIGFSERDFLDEKLSYTLIGKYETYDLKLGFTYGSPDNVTITLGTISSELQSPNISNIETLINREYTRLEREKVETMRLEAEKKAKEQEDARIKLELEAKTKAEAAEAERVANDVLSLPENQAIVSEKKAGIQAVIAQLSGDTAASITKPFILIVPNGEDTLEFEMIPELGTGNLADKDYLETGKKFTITSSKNKYKKGDLGFEFQIFLSIDADKPYNIDLLKIDSIGTHGPKGISNIKDFNGQDTSVFIKYLENYFLEKL